jgi:endonuclease I
LTRAYLGTDAVSYVSRSDLFNNYDVNCEHTFPQGNFNQNLPMRSDIHHLFPTDVDANSTRGSLRFGNVVSGVDWSEGGSQRGLNGSGEQVFEPRDGQKGMSARGILYFLARYQNYGKNGISNIHLLPLMFKEMKIFSHTRTTGIHSLIILRWFTESSHFVQIKIALILESWF